MKTRLIFSLLVGLLFVFSAVNAQEPVSAYPVDKDTQQITYQEVVQQAGTADELYIRCIEWINTQYKNPADACRIRNRESGVIEINHRFEILNDAEGAKLIAGIVNYVLKLEFKPGRYRYTLSDMTLRQSSRFPIEKWMDKNDSMYSPLWDKYLEQVNVQVNELINSLKAGMQPPVIKVEEKW
ncbi:MAG TPA: hypothetical protein DF409_16240 [Bacteroidales bacterium]|jgi:hypothetical protein|nr:hypothetical protein [Bacteroidales bacterium]